MRAGKAPTTVGGATGRGAVLAHAVAIGAVVATTSLAGPSFTVLVASYRYALTPDRLQGRTQSAARLVT